MTIQIYKMISAKFHALPYSAKRWRRKTLANQQNITLANKTLANNLLAEMSGGHRETLAEGSVTR